VNEPVRSIIFDLGGVVLQWNPDAIVANFYADELSRSAAKREIFQHTDWLELDRGILQEPEAIQRFHERTGRPLEEMSALMQATRDSLQPIPETLQILEDLARRGIPLYCLSNMAASTADYLRRHHTFWSLFRGIVISGEIKLMKPDPEIFEHIARRFDLTPHNTVFIDDNFPNIRSAAALGFRTLLFENPHQCRSDLDSFLRHDTLPTIKPA
jgi:putative hydrolase of the HAD superfamily